MLWLAYEAVICLGAHRVTVHIWFVSPSVGLAARCSALSAPFSLPSSVPQHQASKIPAWKKLQNGLVYELINIMATDRDMLLLAFGRD